MIIIDIGRTYFIFIFSKVIYKIVDDKVSFMHFLISKKGILCVLIFMFELVERGRIVFNDFHLLALIRQLSLFSFIYILQSSLLSENNRALVLKFKEMNIKGHISYTLT